jgi:hypothetical protein
MGNCIAGLQVSLCDGELQPGGLVLQVGRLVSSPVVAASSSREQ